MSCRAGMVRGGSSALQPLRATVHFQLRSGTQLRIRDAGPAEKTKSRPPKPSIRRTLSLDTLIMPYLQGHWPKEPDYSSSCVNDKATQTPSSWSEECRGRRGGGGHKRSASWGSAEHLREISNLKHQLQKRSKRASRGGPDRDHHQLHSARGPVPGATQISPHLPLSRITPRLRHSVEGLNLELEGVFVSEEPEDQRSVLDVPDGRRAPMPMQRCSSGSQSDPSPSPHLLGDTPLCPSPSPPPVGTGSPPFLHPKKTYAFQREPPEGCERVTVCEEAPSPAVAQLFLHSCPDPNKVNFTPHRGSAFCRVSLLKPLLPSVDLLFRGLSVSPVASRAPADPGVAGSVGTFPDPACTTAV
ncbi:protein FAM117A-like [Paramormyrops kingsleyae]|uniref:Family with sequence similarity 117 member A n=1 Tax=Paramormyrops kingsleyae TaxID=1676925 RepID=A0A3B3T7V8_9TELE|nr:protein FAM117A-like [Paramormyrops kingsleyae]